MGVPSANLGIWWLAKWDRSLWRVEDTIKEISMGLLRVEPQSRPLLSSKLEGVDETLYSTMLDQSCGFSAAMSLLLA